MITDVARSDGTHPTRHAEAEKIKKHREASAAAGYGYYTAGWTVYGAHFGDFYEKLVRPHFKAAKKRAIANSERGPVACASAARQAAGPMVGGHCALECTRHAMRACARRAGRLSTPRPADA